MLGERQTTHNNRTYIAFIYHS